jgi:dTDP-4-amino-4,6-dideoxygalactose transaminase
MSVAAHNARKPIPYGRQTITPEDIAAVTTALQAEFMTQGPTISAFEEAFASYVGAPYAVALSNGTAALHLCALALDVQPGTRVITSPITFVASANCVLYAGGTVTFADIDPETYQLDIGAGRRLLEAAPKGTYHGIIPVDFAGLVVDMAAWRALADECRSSHLLFSPSQTHCHRRGGNDYHRPKRPVR